MTRTATPLHESVFGRTAHVALAATVALAAGCAGTADRATVEADDPIGGGETPWTSLAFDDANEDIQDDGLSFNLSWRLL